MRGIKLSFSSTGPAFDFSAPVLDFDSTVQNALVNIGTDRGSDPNFPDRGTGLKKSGAVGQMINSAWANHIGNFAALATVSFLQRTEIQSNPFKIQSLKLQCVALVGQRVNFNVYALSVNNEMRGTNLQF